MPKRPNILLVLTDEQRFDHLGCVNPAVRTPALDSLARDGVLFTRAYTSNPSCVPARAAILTGKFPHQCWAPTFITYLPAHETCFPTLLRQHGYHTSYIGKLHLGQAEATLTFDHSNIIDSHVPQPQNPERNSYQRWLFEQGFRHTRELIDQSVGPRCYAEWKTDPEYHVDEFVGDQAAAWVEHEMPDDRPWFCCVSFPGPHSPIDCGSLPEASLYDPADIDMPATRYEMLAEKPPHNSLAHGSPPAPFTPLTEAEIRTVRHAYYANVSLIDRKIGQLVEALKARNAYNDTLILFTSDHGDYLGDFGLIAKGQNIAEVLMRIPFIAKPPAGSVAGKHESSLVSSVDLAATCLTAAGIEVPADMASRDLSSYWQTTADNDDRDMVYMEASGIRCCRDRTWKFAHYHNRSYGELYNLDDDPWEMHNRWDDPRCSEIRTRFQRHLTDLLIGLSPRADVPWNRGAPEL